MASPQETPIVEHVDNVPSNADGSNGSPPEDAAPDQDDPAAEILVAVAVKLPRAATILRFNISAQEQVNEIRQSILEHTAGFEYTCFHLEHDGKRMNDFVPLSDIAGSALELEVRLVSDPYTEGEARIHFMRIRELIVDYGIRNEAVHGVLPGISLLDTVTPPAEASSPSSTPVDDYNFGAAPSLSMLTPTARDAAFKLVKSIALSSWHPPPCHLRQKGHLLYLIVTTNEGEQHQITSHIGGFYVNKSSNSKFDPMPRPAPKGHAAHSLLTLLEAISPSFTPSFAELFQREAGKDPLATVPITNAIPAAPWAVPASNSPQCVHNPDPSRAQEAYLLGGVDNADTLRDWNEEFQSAKELPKDSIYDRIFRERLVSKLFADYVDAATRGAVLVARGEIAPLNPTECADAQIFIYNNVFFSFGADGVGTFATEGGDEAARVATGKDVAGVRLVNQLDIKGLFTAGTVVVDYLGKRVVGQSIVPGIFKQREPGESHIDYGAVDGKDVIAADERFEATFAQLSRAFRVKKHSVWDGTGKKFNLEASIETKGLVGTDGRKYVLDLYRITPLDIAWLEECETEGSPTESTNGSKNPYPHRMTVLRPELVDLFGRQKMRDWVDAEIKRQGDQNGAASPIKAPATENEDSPKVAESLPEAKTDAATTSDDPEQETAEKAKEPTDQPDLTKFQFALNPDVFSGQVPQTDAEKSEMETDEKDVRAACAYLRDEAIPNLLHDLSESDNMSFPIDGASLTRALHKRGINVRYMGRIAALADDPKIKCLRDICVQDMIARSFKHLASSYLRRLPFVLAAACISHLLNCFLGHKLNEKPAADIDPTLRQLYSDVDLAFEHVSPESMRQSLEEQVLRRYRYSLPSGWTEAVKPLAMLREISLKLGLQMESKDYIFSHETSEATAVSPAVAPTNGQPNGNAEGKKKKKKARDGSPASTTSLSASASSPSTFRPDDVINVLPIIKHSCPRSSLAEEALEAGRLSIIQGERKLGQDLLLESLSLHEQIYGILHPEVARTYGTLSMLYHQLDEKEAAVELAKKAVIVAERTLGVDSTETLLNYLNLSLYLHQAGDSRSALVYVKHALELWKIAYGPDHPDTITTINNAAVMLQYLKAYHQSRLWFEESLRICEKVFGKQSVNAATLLFQLAQALALDHDSKGAVNRMRESYNIFLSELGPNDKNTKEAESWLEQLTQNAVSIARQAKDVQARRLRAGVRLPTARTTSIASGAVGAASASGTSKESSIGAAAPQIDSRSIDELIKFIEGDSQTKGPKRKAGRGHPKRRGNVATPA